ncbi:MAG: methyltransferase domain-containing protein [Thermomicrobia bacterium]|nr:methyltransferase domain-containing protein [Thermomicrobia bacterium]MCA1722674.1 methyltransferase domain-containing protein [Thermomicrobia bacterium]
MSGNLEAALFTAVDRTRDPDFFVRFMDEGHTLPNVRVCKDLLRHRLGLRAGDAILDVGCGPGISLLEMAALVGPTGRCVGLDASETMIAAARRRAEQTRVPAAFEVGDAQALPYPDGTFDVCHSERVLMHVPDAERVVAEMVRVARPGGRIGILDIDQETMVADSADRQTTRTIVHTFTDAIRNGWIGRQLPRLLKERGLEDVSVDAVEVFTTYAFAELLLGGHTTRLQAEGALTPEEVRAWWGGLRAAAERGVFLLGFTAFIVAGTKPGEG